MTDTSGTLLPVPRTGVPVRRRTLMVAGFALLYVASAALLVASFHAAATGNRQAGFALFWLGALPPFLATAALAAHRPAPPAAVSAVAALAAFGTLPKLLRTPAGPLYFDELMHWRQTADMTRTGLVGQPNSMLTALPGFPGLHALTSSLAQLVGAPAWPVGVAVVTVAHILGLVGVWALARQALPDGVDAGGRVGVLAAVVYAANGEWMFFDTQFAYETFAVPLVVWALVVAGSALRATGRRRLRLLVALALLSFAVAVTHHASALTLVALLVFLLVVVAATTRTRSAWWALAGGVGGSLVVVGGWLAPQAGLLASYLGPNLTGPLQQVAALLSGPTGHTASGSHAPGHSLFSGTTLPPYEVVCALATPLLLAGTVAAVLAGQVRWWLRRRRHAAPAAAPLGARWWATPLARVLTVLAGVYLATLPLMMTASGSELVRRSWTYTWLGVGFAVAVAVDDMLDRPPLLGRGWRRAVALLALAVLVVGNVAAGQDEAYRFPGPYQVGSDTRSLDAETTAVATWMAGHVQPGSWITTDRYTASFLASYGRMDLVVPWQQLPLWNLVTRPTTSPAVWRALLEADVKYLIVDDRMATTKPASGFWYDVGEPARVHARPVPVGWLRRFDCLPWSTPVYTSGHYTVYKLDPARFEAATEAAVTRSLVSASGQRPGSLTWGPLTRRARRVLNTRECP